MASFTPVRLTYNEFEPDGSVTDHLTPVIFLHGLNASKEHWEDIPQIVADKTKRKTYALDARNHGDSEWNDEFSFDLNAVDLLYFMKTAGVKRAIIVGHSMGGITAMKVAVKYPECIEGIVIEDVGARRLVPDTFNFLTTYLRHLQKVVKDIPPELAEKEANEYAMELCCKTAPKELATYIEKVYKEEPQNIFSLKRDSEGRYTNKANFDAILNGLKKTANIQSYLDEGQYEGLAHFIYGERSILKVFEDKDYIRQFFPNAVFMGIEKASHKVHTDCPKEFIGALLKSLG